MGFVAGGKTAAAALDELAAQRELGAGNIKNALKLLLRKGAAIIADEEGNVIVVDIAGENHGAIGGGTTESIVEKADQRPGKGFGVAVGYGGMNRAEHAQRMVPNLSREPVNGFIHDRAGIRSHGKSFPAPRGMVGNKVHFTITYHK